MKFSFSYKENGKQSVSVFLLMCVTIFCFSLQGTNAKEKKTDKAKKQIEQSRKKTTQGVLSKPAAVRLLRNTMIAIDQANRTGNYSVLRGLGNRNFQHRFSPADLAISFRTVREKKFDLSNLVHLNPILTRKPEVTKSGLVNLAGYFPTKPMRVVFDLTFQSVRKEWYIADLAVGIKDDKKPSKPNRNKKK